MIPRLPPLLLAVLGGASVYGIKYALDKVEQKAIGPPGSSDHYEKVLKYRQNVKRLGIAAAVSGVIYTGYWLYESRIHRNSPATLKNTQQDRQTFYQDQYSAREKRLQIEKAELDKKQKEKELQAQKHLQQEVISMEHVINLNKEK